MQHGYFTPVYWSILDEYDQLSVIDVVILGRILGFCMGVHEQCDASQSKIAKQCHVSPRTVWASIQKLKATGLISDITPYAKNVPHAYIDTGKAEKYCPKRNLRGKN